MWHFKDLTLKRFMSHNDSTFIFKNGIASLLLGVNETDEGQESNGSGKSAILEALSILLINTVMRADTSMKDLVKLGSKSFEIETSLWNDLNNDTLTIKRIGYNNTKSSEILIKFNGDYPIELPLNDKDRHDVKEATKYIIDKIGISKEDLIYYFLISKDKYKPFFGVSEKIKQQVIGRFSSSNLIDPIFENIKDEVKDFDAKIVNLNNKRGIIESNKELYQTKLQTFDLSKIEEERQSRIEAINKNLIIKESDLQKVERELVAYERAVESLSNSKVSLSDVDQEGIDEIQAEIVKLKAEKVDIVKDKREIELDQETDESTKKKLERKIRTLNTELSGGIDCPKCSHKFWLGDKDRTIEAIKLELRAANSDLIDSEDALKELKLELAGVKLDLVEVDEDIDERGDRMADLQKAKIANDALILAAKRQISQAKSSVDTTTILVESKRSLVAELQKQIDQIEKQIVNDKSIEYQTEIDQLDAQLAEIDVEIDKLTQSKIDVGLWESHFTRFKTHLSNKAIAVIQMHCNNYLTKLKTNLKLHIEGYKINRDKSIREKITTSVMRNGVDEGALGKFSSGERVRLEIAMILSLQKLINLNSPTGGLDLCWMDEVIESVDGKGIGHIMNALKGLKQTIVVVTHGSFEENYTSNHVVEKVNNNSIIYND